MKKLDAMGIPKDMQAAVIENIDKLPNKNQDLVIFKIFICKDNAKPDSAPTSIKLNFDKDI